MRKILEPSIKLMNSLKYLQKFILIFLIFLLPITTMILLNIQQANKEYAFRKMQRMGLEYNIALRSLIQHVQQHRGLVAVYWGDKNSLGNSISDKEKEISENIKEIDKVDQHYGQALAVNADWLKIKNQWSSVEASSSKSSLEEAYNSHTKLIDEMLSLNYKVADNSKLIIQSRPECYYLVDSIINELTNTAEYMGQARAIGAGAAGKGYLTEADRTKLQYLYITISSSLKDNMKAMQSAYNNVYIKTALEKPYNDAVISTNNMLELLNSELLQSKTITISSENYFNVTTNSINKIYDLLIAESNIVDQISSQDYIQTVQRKNSLLLFTILILIILLYLFAGFYMSIKGGITAIEIAADSIASGKLTERVQLEAKDETQKIGRALNKMLNTLIKNYTEARTARNALEKLAHYDNLTGLANRALFIRKLENAVQEANLNNKTTALLFMDLDRFKIINDTLGHAVGDTVLRIVALRLLDIIGDRGTVCRLGGDEFTILLPDILDKASLVPLISQLTEAIEKPMLLEGANYTIGTSIGYALFPDDAKTSDELLSKADNSMYQVKQERKAKALKN